MLSFRRSCSRLRRELREGGGHQADEVEAALLTAIGADGPSVDEMTTISPMGDAKWDLHVESLSCGATLDCGRAATRQPEATKTTLARTTS